MRKQSRLNFQNALPTAKIVRGRHPFIVNYCSGKKILHIGCVDSGLMEERYYKNELLHQKLDKVASLLYGVDIDVNGINFFKKKGFDNLFIADICDESQRCVLDFVEFDVIILSEVIEHLINPGLMLESIKKLMNDETVLLVSVPNAFNAITLWNMLTNIEFVHPDHNYYFSFITFNNILKKSGLDIRETYVYSFSEHAFKKQHGAIRVVYWDLTRKYKSASNWLVFIKNLYLDSFSWIKNFFKNQFFRFLYSRSGFFGDGLFAICQLNKKK